jgi:hypothetical protein
MGQEKVMPGLCNKSVERNDRMTENETINHDEILDLSHQLFDEETRQSFMKISLQILAIPRTESSHACVERLRNPITVIDKKIGGVGIDQLLVPTSNGYTADIPNLPMETRSLYRPLQYALSAMLQSNWPRTAVQMSCQHIEGVMKQKYGGVVRGIDHMPLGSIIRHVKSMTLLDAERVQQLVKVAAVLNIAKHEYGSDAIRIPGSLRRDAESQVFNIHEAVSMYFICRKVGVKLLAGS